MDTPLKTRPCWVEIDTRALEHNYRFLQSAASAGVECLAVVKANAYGHGLEICAPAAVRAGARWLGVTSVEEAVAARAACGPEPHILAIGGVFPGQGAAVVAHRITCVVWEPQHLDELEIAARAAGSGAGSIAVHLEIDTGMSRQGIAPEALDGLLRRFGKGSPLRLEAVMTHLYASDDATGEATAGQLARLEGALASIRARLNDSTPGAEYLSVGASAALLGSGADALRAMAAKWNLRPMLRLGLALYGLVPEFEPDFAGNETPDVLREAREQLRPVLTWKTQVVSVREIPAGAEVGYNGTFVATEAMRVALIAAGYADGLDRKLGNGFSLLVRGQRAPLVGRVSMDQSVLDVTEIEGIAPGDEVVIVGTQGGETITAFDHARAAGTIPWEVFTRIGERVARVEVGGE